MIDPLVVVGILAIYVGAIITIYFAGLRTEIWQLRNARREFHNNYVDKVTQLRGRAEYALLTTIYESDKLREVFDRRRNPETDQRLLPDADRTEIEKEIERISIGLHEVTDPRSLFEGVCTDYDTQASALETVVHSSIAMSTIIPIVVVGYWVSPSTAPGLWVFVGLVLLILTVPPLSTRWQAYKIARDRRTTNEAKLIKAVDEKIFMPPPEGRDIPPTSPPSVESTSSAETPSGAPHPVPRANSSEPGTERQEVAPQAQES